MNSTPHPAVVVHASHMGFVAQDPANVAVPQYSLPDGEGMPSWTRCRAIWRTDSRCSVYQWKIFRTTWPPAHAPLRGPGHCPVERPLCSHTLLFRISLHLAGLCTLATAVTFCHLGPLVFGKFLDLHQKTAIAVLRRWLLKKVHAHPETFKCLKNQHLVGTRERRSRLDPIPASRILLHSFFADHLITDGQKNQELDHYLYHPYYTWVLVYSGP